MTRILAVANLTKAAAAGSDFDAVVLVGHQLALAHVHLPLLKAPLQALAKADASFAATGGFVAAEGLAGGRLATAPTGPLTRDHDDVRRYAEAARQGVRRARDAGAKQILLLVQPRPLPALQSHPH